MATLVIEATPSLRGVSVASDEAISFIKPANSSLRGVSGANDEVISSKFRQNPNEIASASSKPRNDGG
ncbi:MAG: hypothetical protein SPJ69_07660 [Campylobacter sp.]|uniref:hypothetical protein n=1 Tax=Campylobacter sp. TaxID=205 RepID=UPI0029763547|nr:hypothetical protein [Campylobacter sp.]MDD7600633.1 hypothetical protein [Campylobacteraceae bacterium]MDY5888179.1 hypothetical protein [Campylobacter sp.]